MEDRIDFVYQILGLVGGFACSIALIPQIIHAHKTKSARDLSYTWQALARVIPSHSGAFLCGVPHPIQVFYREAVAREQWRRAREGGGSRRRCRCCP
ncbi:unnamed protein product [Discosporangium mesarthrocarpum]